MFKGEESSSSSLCKGLKVESTRKILILAFVYGLIVRSN